MHKLRGSNCNNEENKTVAPVIRAVINFTKMWTYKCADNVFSRLLHFLEYKLDHYIDLQSLSTYIPLKLISSFIIKYLKAGKIVGLFHKLMKYRRTFLKDLNYFIIFIDNENIIFLFVLQKHVFRLILRLISEPINKIALLFLLYYI